MPFVVRFPSLQPVLVSPQNPSPSCLPEDRAQTSGNRKVYLAYSAGQCQPGGEILEHVRVIDIDSLLDRA